MELSDAIRKSISTVVFYRHDDMVVAERDLYSARDCRCLAGKVAARTFSLIIGCYELFYDATGRYLGRQWLPIYDRVN